MDGFYRRRCTRGPLAQHSLYRGPSLHSCLLHTACCRSARDTSPCTHSEGQWEAAAAEGFQDPAAELCRHAAWNEEHQEASDRCGKGGHTVGPHVPPADDPAIGGWAEGVGGVRQPHRGNIFRKCDLFLQPDQGEVIYVTVARDFVLRVSDDIFDGHIAHGCLLEAVRPDPDH